MKRFCVFVLLWMVSVGLFLYPGVSTILRNNALADKGGSWIEANSTVDVQEVDKAKTYNSELSAYPVIDPWLTPDVLKSDRYRYYHTLLMANGQMGVLDIPRFNQRLPIYHDAPDALEKGVQHLYGTSLPVGGKGSMSVLSGHTGLPSMTVFDNVPKLKAGDELIIHAGGQELVYEMTSFKVVEPTDVHAIKMDPARDQLVLITCWPYGVNSKRWLVYADRVDREPKEEVHFPSAEIPELALPVKVMLGVGGVVFVGGLIHISREAAILVRLRRRKDAES